MGALSWRDELPAAVRALLGHERGAPLPPPTRAAMEWHFGEDLRHVRVHTSTAAAESARNVGARAYTVGPDVVFGAGRYAPESADGKRLLAHELAHVVQQSRGASAGPAAAPNGGHEQAADTAARGVAAGGTVQVAGASAVGLAREANPAGGVPTLRIDRLEIRPNAIVVYTNHGFCAFMGTYSFSKQSPDPAGYKVTAALVPRPGGKEGFFLKTDAASDVKAKLKAAVPTDGAHEGTWSALPPHFVLDPQSHEVILKVIAEPFGGGGGGNKGAHGGASRPAPKLKFGKAPKQGGERDGERTPSDEGSETGDPRVTVLPAYPAELTGPEVQAIGGTGEYQMSLRQSFIAGSSMLNQMSDAMNWVDYAWDVFQVRGGKLDQSRLKIGGAALRRGEAEVERDTKTADENLARNLRREDYGGAAADIVAGQLENASRVVKIAGALVEGGAALTSNQDYIRGFVWPDTEGTFIVRVKAQPADRPQKDGRILRFKPSIETKVVEVKKTTEIAEAELARGEKEMEEAGVQLEEARLALSVARDPAQRARLQEAVDALESSASGKPIESLRSAYARVNREREEAKGDPIRMRKLNEQREELEKQIEQAVDRQRSTAGDPVLLHAVLTSEVTAASYPLLLQLRVEKPTGAGGSYIAHLSDVTSRRGKNDYGGVGATPGEAIWKAVADLAGNNDYGSGVLAARVLTERVCGGLTVVPMRRSFANKPTDDVALVRGRLRDLATVVGTVAVFVPGLGQAALVLGAAVAADRLIERYRRDTLYVDGESLGDVLSLLSAFAAGAQAVGRLAAVRAGNRYLIRLGGGLEKGAGFANQALDKVQLFEVSVAVIENLRQINDAEASQKMTPLEARRQRVRLLSGVVHTLGQQVAGGVHARAAQRAPAAQGGPRSARGPQPPAMHEAPPPETAGPPLRGPRMASPKRPAFAEGAPQPMPEATPARAMASEAAELAPKAAGQPAPPSSAAGTADAPPPSTARTEGSPRAGARPRDGGPLVVDLQAGTPDFLRSQVAAQPGTQGVGIEAGDYMIGYRGVHPTSPPDLRMSRQIVQNVPDWPNTPAHEFPVGRLQDAPRMQPHEIDPAGELFPRQGDVRMLRPGPTGEPVPFFPAQGQEGRLIPRNQNDVTSLQPTTHPELHGKVDRAYWRRPFALQKTDGPTRVAMGQEINKMLRAGGFVEFRVLAAKDRTVILGDVSEQISGARTVEVTREEIRGFLERGELPGGRDRAEKAAILQDARPDLLGEYSPKGEGTFARIIRIYKDSGGAAEPASSASAAAPRLRRPRREPPSASTRRLRCRCWRRPTWARRGRRRRGTGCGCPGRAAGRALRPSQRAGPRQHAGWILPPLGAPGGPLPSAANEGQRRGGSPGVRGGAATAWQRAGATGTGQERSECRRARPHRRARSRL